MTKKERQEKRKFEILDLFHFCIAAAEEMGRVGIDTDPERWWSMYMMRYWYQQKLFMCLLRRRPTDEEMNYGNGVDFLDLDDVKALLKSDELKTFVERNVKSSGNWKTFRYDEDK